MEAIEDYLALNYRTSVYRDDDGDYVVEVDDLPGCVAHGSTPNEAFQDMEEAKRVWMESRIAAGLEIPEPRQIEEYSGRVLLRMPKWLHHRLATQARIERASLNQYIVSLLSDASARQERGFRESVQGPVYIYGAEGPPVASWQYQGFFERATIQGRRESFNIALAQGMWAGLSPLDVGTLTVNRGTRRLLKEAEEEGITNLPSA
jgi:predicted RNase H-like HicB family nuclease